jgi:multidrug efflux pump subunit AcrB
MWIVRLALNRPYTFVVLALLLFLMAPVMLLRTPVDIFPEINIPVVSIIWTYTGLVPQEMETRITSIYERALTTTVGDVEHIESQSLNGVAVIKFYLQPQANVEGAIAEVDAEAQATMKQLPQGITPPLVIRYSASTVPILQLGLSGKGLSEQQLNDMGTNFIRPQLATIPGAAVPLPYGGKVRQIMVDIDSARLKSEGLSPLDVVNAVNAQNVILPSGTAKIGKTEYNVGLNGTPVTVQQLNNLPVKTVNDGTIFLHDVAHVRDGYAVQQNIVRQDGQRGALLTVEKAGNASTLAIVSGIRAALPAIAATLPPELVIRPLADQSIFVKASLNGVVREGLIAATLTSIMILVFLGSIGVATSNSVLVITFANEHFAESRDSFKAAMEAGATRLRPVMMTALAMIIGMIPMALGLGDGGEQNAPLGRAVIGGLLFATVATLFFVPIVFAVIRRNANPPISTSEVAHEA